MFQKTDHKFRWIEAVEKADAVGADGIVNSCFAAPLCLLTASAELWERLSRFVSAGEIDFPSMMELGLSSGERVMVAVAGNLYNGGNYGGESITPMDIMSRLDEESFYQVMSAISGRRRITILEGHVVSSVASCYDMT